MKLFKKKKNTTTSIESDLPSYKVQILEFFKTNASVTYTIRQIYEQLNARDRKSKNKIKETILALAQEGIIHEPQKKHFTWQNNPSNIIGKVDYVNPAYAYIISQDSAVDIRVRKKNLLGALDKDLVKVRIIRMGKNEKNPTGKIVEVLERAKKQFVGQLILHENTAWVTPDDKRMHDNILVPHNALQHAQHNDKVVVDITNWPSTYQKPAGKIDKVLGQAGVHETEMNAIMVEFGLSDQFSSAVLEEVQSILPGITSKTIQQRKDFRHTPTLSIDPEDAKDFDDALSFKKLSNGNYEVGVHIADVSHYIPEESKLDQAAFARGTSVYLVDRTLPMLPEKLSNDLCSLKPNEDRLTFSIVFELDPNAYIKAMWVGETIIHIDQNFTYEKAQQVIDEQKGTFYEILTTLNQLAKKLRQQRFENGSINFETTEVKFQLDAQGNPLQIVPKVRTDTHKLIEEFMLLTNKQVAERIHRMKSSKAALPFVYRTHDFPDPEKLSNFALFVKKLGYQVDPKPGAIAASLNALSKTIEGKAEENIIQTLAIRSMPKALYTTEPKSHFALAFSHYTHFTSPIRRYPDLMVHRLLKSYLKKEFKDDKNAYEEKCKHALERERIATEAERASVKYKQVVFMEQFKEEALEGVISGITDWGMYVEIKDTQCEGMVRLADIEDDYYQLDEKNFRVVGKQLQKIYNLGDTVRVKVKACDITKRFIDLTLVA